MVNVESKYSRALEIYDSVDPDKYPTQRSFSAAVISRFISELDMTKTCARTYAYRIRQSHKQSVTNLD